MVFETQIYETKERCANGSTVTRTTTIAPIEALKLVDIEMKDLKYFRNGKEMMELFFDALQGTINSFRFPRAFSCVASNPHFAC